MIKRRYVLGAAGAAVLLCVAMSAAAEAAPHHSRADSGRNHGGATGHVAAAPRGSDPTTGLSGGTDGVANPTGPAQPPVINGGGPQPLPSIPPFLGGATPAAPPTTPTSISTAPPPLALDFASGDGSPGESGKFSNICYYDHTAKDDPIVFPNQPGASHSHDFIGNTTTTAASTLASLTAGSSNCVDSLDKAGYWVPTLYDGTTAVHPSSVTVYYLDNHKKNIQPYPAGLEELAGNAHAASTADEHDVRWGCSTGVPTLPQAPTCAAGEHLHVRIDFPDCWDGKNLTSTNHVSQVAYSTNGVCPTGYPVPVPMLSLLVKYDTNGGAGTVLASGPTYTMHADFFNAWNPAELQRLVTTCINAQVKCARPDK
jgi:uncharacterized protein DUF1996